MHQKDEKRREEKRNDSINEMRFSLCAEQEHTSNELYFSSLILLLSVSGCIFSLMFLLFNEEDCEINVIFFRGQAYRQLDLYFIFKKKNVVSKLIISLPPLPLLLLLGCQFAKMSAITNQNINNLHQHLATWKFGLALCAQLLIIECNNSRIIYLIFTLKSGEGKKPQKNRQCRRYVDTFFYPTSVHNQFCNYTMPFHSLRKHI